MGSDSIREMLKVESGDPVPENRRLTIFGATDDNMKGVDFTQDSRYLERVSIDYRLVLMHASMWT